MLNKFRSSGLLNLINRFAARELIVDTAACRLCGDW